MKTLLFMTLLLQTSVAQSGTGVIAGRLTTADGAPAKGIRVMVMTPPESGQTDSSTLVSLTMTDESGDYRLEDIPQGRYYIAAGSVDNPVFYPGAAVRSEGKIVSIASGSAIKGMDFKLVRALSSRDIPTLYEVLVRVIVEDGGPFPLLTFTKSSSGATASHMPRADGTIGLEILEGDHTFLIKDVAPGYRIKSLTYGSTDLLTNPLRLSLTQTQEIRLTLSPSKPGAWVKLTGRIPNLDSITSRVVLTPIVPSVATGTPIPTDLSRTIRPTRVGLMIGAPANMVTEVRADGSFEIPAVLQGNYRLSLNLVNTDLPMFSRSAHAPGMDATAMLTVGDKAISGIEIGGADQRRVRGRVLVEGDIPTPNFRMILTADSSTPITVYPAIQPDGSLQAYFPTGRYRFALGGLPDGYTTIAVRYGTSDLLNGPLTVTVADSSDLIVELATTTRLKTVKVGGRVLGPASPSPRISMSSADSQQERLLAKDGTFEFSKVPFGNQTVMLSFGASTFNEASIRIDGTRDWPSLLFVVVTGHLVFDGIAPPASYSIEARNTSRDMPLMTSSTLSPTGSGLRESSIHPDGTFSIVLTGGEQEIRVVDLPVEYEVRSILYGSKEVWRQLLKIDADETPDELKITIGRKP